MECLLLLTTCSLRSLKRKNLLPVQGRHTGYCQRLLGGLAEQTLPESTRKVEELVDRQTPCQLELPACAGQNMQGNNNDTGIQSSFCGCELSYRLASEQQPYGCRLSEELS